MKFSANFEAVRKNLRKMWVDPLDRFADEIITEVQKLADVSRKSSVNAYNKPYPDASSLK